MEGSELFDDRMMEGDAVWKDGARITPYHIRCDDGSEYWRVVHERAGETLWSRTNPSREMAFKLVYEEMAFRKKLKQP